MTGQKRARVLQRCGTRDGEELDGEELDGEE